MAVQPPLLSLTVHTRTWSSTWIGAQSNCKNGKNSKKYKSFLWVINQITTYLDMFKRMNDILVQFVNYIEQMVNS